MQIIEPNVVPVTPISQGLLFQIENAGRTCYKSTSPQTLEGAEKFVRGLIKRGHEAMVEHAVVTIVLTNDRGVSHEEVRHRIASYAQESTRYCNYGKDKFGGQITYIDLRGGMELDPVVSQLPKEQFDRIYAEWIEACVDAERHYLNMLEYGATPQIARSVLNNSTKTEIVITMNCREWRHFLSLRCAPDAHPQMRQVALKILQLFREGCPVLVEDIPY